MIKDLDELGGVDWGALSHAWGAADDVPDLLRRLVGPDPRGRADALGELRGTVHRHGDVFDGTVAAIPFLLAVAGDARVPDRAGVLRLLAGIGGATRREDPGPDCTAARAAVAGAAPLLLRLLDDADPEVRRAVPAALLVQRGDAGPALAALRARLAVEPDADVRGALAAAVAGLGRLAAAGLVSGVDPIAAGAWFAGWLTAPDPAGAQVRGRLTAVADLVGTAPEALAGDLVPVVAGLLRADLEAADQALPALRVSRVEDLTDLVSPARLDGPVAAAGSRDALVEDLSMSLRERVEDRVELLTCLLAAGAPAARSAALRPALGLIGYWRGDYTGLVTLLGAQLTDGRLAGRAALVLEHLDALAAPATDALADAVMSAAPASPYGDGPPPWVVTWPGWEPTVGPTLWALAALHDDRALPAVRAVLDRDVPVRGAGPLVTRYATTAPDLLATLRRRCTAQAGSAAAGHRRLLALLATALGPAAAEAVPELLAGPIDPVTANALGRIGPDAAAAVPALRGMLDRDDGVEAVVAVVLWQVTGEAGQAVELLARHLDDPWDATAGVADAAGRLGPAGAALEAPLRALVDADDDRVHVAAARALWRITGDAETPLPVLARLWTARPARRAEIAAHLAAIGPAARALRDLAAAEARQPFRHSAALNGWSSRQVALDVALLRDCRTILDATG
ncbi:hypothetical protein Daura_18895 [Dactylosporangium aurantiacum]|uniref:PBS lyase HEAT domain protein repeat-containing protein n=1 Tax=Dactylosporangium aurantiacum TaxID=35754 RepID=A0A9Q9IKY0_9ACTN|nr:hypothetical protein [Dactylosporangium aurantiacum]MDG6105759.1 hypothetical protein [Dactylosporangium aurantiacum]UWZ58049.1 hypothetical protein Daura_18895 [Dactylosporangium aurantiacum]